MIKRILSIVLALLMLLSCAAAEEEVPELYLSDGDLPSRGVIMDLSQADLENGVQVITYVDPNGNTPAILFGYADREAYLTAMKEGLEYFAIGNIAEYERVAAEYSERNYTFAGIYLLPDAEIPAWIYDTYKDAAVLGENDGYTYVLATYDYTVSPKDDPAVVEAAHARVNEMIASIQYQPVVIPEDELAVPVLEVPNAFPTFTTQDLNGNTVDNSIFAKADLTVLNIWGTSCYPCIAEMPELQEWSEEMPENVQMMGLVLDATPGNTDSIEIAQAICEMTGVTYTNLLVCADMAEFAKDIMFTPTTIFVARTGAIVGEPVVGAHVDGYKAAVEAYFAQ